MFDLSDKTFNTLTKIQKVLLTVLTVTSVLVSVLFVVTAKGSDVFEEKIRFYNTALNNLLFASSMICALIYANKGYTKEASKFYKAFMCLYAFSTIIQVVTLSRLSGFNLGVLSCTVRFVLILALGFVKDLGEKNTWPVFYILLALELLMAPLSVSSFSEVAAENKGVLTGFLVYNALVRLVTTGILGLCIEAKYRDKKARGSK